MLNFKLKAAEKRVIESLASMWDVFDWHPLAALVTSAKTAIRLVGGVLFHGNVVYSEDEI
jgi:hypothetical protein